MMSLFSTVPGSALVCHNLPFHRLSHNATDWPKAKCFYVYRLKCSEALGMMGRMGWVTPRL